MAYRNYTDEDFITAVAKVKSIAGLLRELNLIVAGGNYIHAKKNIARLKLDTSHWTGELWSKGERLKDWEDYNKSTQLKKHLIIERGHKCESCSLDKWLGREITLELEHVDGNRSNNKIHNLKLLCPNCHSQTKTWRRRKKQ